MPSLNSICRRCGTCCKKGGPALHREDLQLIRDNVIDLAHLTTLRQGELVTDNVNGKLVSLKKEIIKLKAVPNGRACIFYLAKQQACSIHADSPLECQALFCADPSSLAAIYDQGRLTRFDILSKDGGLAELARYHEEKCPVTRLAKLAPQAASGEATALEELSELLNLDKTLRQVFFERTGTSEELEFLFGRPLGKVIEGFGLKLGQGEKGPLLEKTAAPSLDLD